MKILIVGLGSIGKKHVDSLLEILGRECKIYALRHKRSSKPYKDVINIFSVEKIIKEIDFIIISNISSAHYENMLKLIGYNKPIFVEKPIVSNLKDLESLEKSLVNFESFIYVACNLRFHPIIKELKKFYEKKNQVINEVNIYCGSYLPNWRKDVDFQETYSVDRRKGGGVDLDLIHEIDYAHWIFGFPENCFVRKTNKSSLKINAPDQAIYFWEYEKFNITIQLNYYRTDTTRFVQVITDKHTYRFDLVENQIILEDLNKVLWTCEYENTYVSQLNYFIHCLRNNKIPMNGINEASNILKLSLQNGNT